MNMFPTAYFSRSIAPTCSPSRIFLPTSLAISIAQWNIRRLKGLASSIRIITVVSWVSNTRGGAKK